MCHSLRKTDRPPCRSPFGFIISARSSAPHWGNIGIRYYGLGYVLGFLAAAWLLNRYARAGRSQLPPAEIGDLIIVSLPVSCWAGALVLSCLPGKSPRRYPARSAELFPRVEGGMASHGGFVGVAVALWWFARRARIPFLHLGDLIVSVTPPGLSSCVSPTSSTANSGVSRRASRGP